MLFGVELDAHDNIMPQKLKYNELPENYPKELDEMFNFYYECIINPNEMRTISFQEELCLYYLNWLALQSVPEYIYEYSTLNQGVSNEYFTKENINQYAILPYSSGVIRRILNHPHSIEDFYTQHPKLRHIVGFSTPKWVKAEILDFERYDRQNYTNLVTKVKVIDDLSGEMLTDELTIVISGSTEKMFPDSGKAQFQRGKTFLIASGPTFLNTITKNIEYDGNLLDTNNPIIFYTSAIHCFEVIDDEFTWETTCNYWLREIQSFLFAGEAQGISCADGHSVFITLPIEQEGSKISYQIVRDRLTEQMDFLRQYKDVKLNNKKDEY
jgi:hypothetical protein